MARSQAQIFFPKHIQYIDQIETVVTKLCGGGVLIAISDMVFGAVIFLSAAAIFLTLFFLTSRAYHLIMCSMASFILILFILPLLLSVHCHIAVITKTPFLSSGVTLRVAMHYFITRWSLMIGPHSTTNTLWTLPSTC
jgi:hypothetical protein